MILNQDETGLFTRVADGRSLMNTHNELACAGRGCAIHNHPSEHPLKDAPLSWDNARQFLNRLCEHGIEHPDADSAAFLKSQGLAGRNIHDCDDCCGLPKAYRRSITS